MLKRPSGLTLFLQKEQELSRFVVASAKQDRIAIAACGEVPTEGCLEKIAETLHREKLKPKNLVCLLPRSEFEMNVFQLPDIEEDEIPQLVSNLVTEANDETEITTDYVLNFPDEAGQNALALSLRNSTLELLHNESRQVGMNLSAVTFHGMGAISLWRTLVPVKSPHAVIVTIANKAIDFSVIYHHKVMHVRSIPFQNDDIAQITARLISELQRTVAITGNNEETESTRIYLFGSPEKRSPIAESLTTEFDVPVSILNPLNSLDPGSQQISLEESEAYAHLIGTANAVHLAELDLDFISPRRPEQKTWPWQKIGIWSLVASVLFAAGGFVISDDAAQQTTEISEKRTEFDDLAMDARRVIEMKDELAAIRAWRRSEVIWLDQIDELSLKLPPREESLIRRIAMSVGNDGSSKIDLSVEVAQNELVVGLENAIRSKTNQVKSKRVSESSDKTGEKWKFETSIQFTAKPPKLSFIEQDLPPEQKSPETSSEELK
ncbi:MAG: hypothetical protein VX438_14510 [Planctomycetota bacterium]|nr:hypothetical protein [Planctomycetota bacterium]